MQFSVPESKEDVFFIITKTVFPGIFPLQEGPARQGKGRSTGDGVEPVDCIRMQLFTRIAKTGLSLSADHYFTCGTMTGGRQLAQ